ncbi:MAG: hypothetical protein EAX96_19195 [Candidatus Lokiarchaeota archaeon]|nr:hypothetical protein [Candidatus Lokiarchaeota archaeon]
MHFINKIINQKADNFVHDRFVKFSKGQFKNGGPVLSLKSTAGNKSWSFNASYEYEDQIGIFFGLSAPEGAYIVKGSIYTLPRISLEEIPIFKDRTWLEGKRDLKQLHYITLDEEMDIKQISELYEKLNPYCAILLTIAPSKGKTWKFVTKDKIPSLKSIQDKDPLQECKDDKQEKCNDRGICEKTGVCIEKRIGFAKLKTGPIDDKGVESFFKLFLPDFNNIPHSFKEIRLINSYNIDEIKLPENKNALNSKDLRLQAKKIGKIKRILWVDDKFFETEIPFSV